MNAEKKQTLSALIVSYNTREMTLDCLRTLIVALHGMESEIIVVDNASSDGSVAALMAEFPVVQLIANSENVGFGAANNQAMAQANGDFFLLLNSDAFPESDAIQVLLDYMLANKKAGVTGPRIANRDGSLQRSCFRLPSPSYAWLENLGLSDGYRRWPHDSIRSVDFVIGACMMVRREVYEEVGGFDERFFMYSEEADWQRRIREAGWDIVFVPDARVRHLGGASGASDKSMTNGYFFDSLDAYVSKHHGVCGLVSLRAAMVVGCFVRACVWGVKALLPRRRETALPKLRLHLWLLLRQATRW